jgi:hypothetical protein
MATASEMDASKRTRTYNESEKVTNENEHPGAHWKIWKTADKLEASITSRNFYPEITPKVVSILREWGKKFAGDELWISLLNKGSLHHEIEESIVAIHHLMTGIGTGDTNRGGDDDPLIVLDVCAGKGLFSFLLSYLRHPRIAQIVMLEKAAINWHHIEVGNKTAELEGRPNITIWANTNLHDYDEVLDRVIDLEHPVALSGIHLCKQLSPSFCGLVNGLGRRCVYACLTPCCMPRAVTSQKNHRKNKEKKFTLSIQLEETALERKERRDYMSRRERVRRKPIGGPCFYCHDENHGLLDCPILPTLPNEEQITIRQGWHAATVPCWNCLEYGHFKTACPNVKEGGAFGVPAMKSSSSHNSRMPPALSLDVSDVLKALRPYSRYCDLLATCFQTNNLREVKVIETELQKFGNHQEGNWNSERKSIFIIVK